MLSAGRQRALPHLRSGAGAAQLRNTSVATLAEEHRFFVACWDVCCACSGCGAGKCCRQAGSTPCLTSADPQRNCGNAEIDTDLVKANGTVRLVVW